jgi:hypothetical protein
MPKSVNQSKHDRQRDTTLARGGRTKMFGPQAANPQKPGGTAHAVKGGAPGARAARGGPKVHAGGRSVPAAPGSTGPR